MKPFQEYELSKVIANQWTVIRQRIDKISNEEIMANDLDILAENLYQEFYIEPVIVFDEDFSKRNILQGKIQKYVEPFFRDFYRNEYIEVDGIIANFYFPYVGDKTLFQCRASTFTLGGYPEITVDKNTVQFCLERSLSEMKSMSAKEDLLKSLEISLNITFPTSETI